MVGQRFGELTVLRDEREKRGLSRDGLAEMSGISASWIRDIEEGEKPSVDAKQALRGALERCPIHERFGVACDHKLPVPPDEELYAPSDK